MEFLVCYNIGLEVNNFFLSSLLRKIIQFLCLSFSPKHLVQIMYCADKWETLALTSFLENMCERCYPEAWVGHHSSSHVCCVLRISCSNLRSQFEVKSFIDSWITSQWSLSSLTFFCPVWFYSFVRIRYFLLFADYVRYVYCPLSFPTLVSTLKISDLFVSPLFLDHKCVDIEEPV